MGSSKVPNKSELKEAEKKRVDSIVNKLHMLFTYVRKTDNSDRYIVSEGGNWGVVSGDGIILIPFDFTNITMSGKKIFRVYTDVFSTGATGFTPETYKFYDIKKQGIYDLDGNELVKPSEYTKVRLLGKKGIILGADRYSLQYDAPLHIVLYNGAVIEFSKDVDYVNILNLVEDIILIHYKRDSNDRRYAIRLDKLEPNKKVSELEVRKPLDEIYDSIDEIESGSIHTPFKDTYDTRYIATFGNNKCYLVENYVPLNVVVTSTAVTGKKALKTAKIFEVYNGVKEG